MNKPLKVLLVLISLILTIVLTGLITAYSIRNIASKYITEEYIREIINSIEYNEIVKEYIDTKEIEEALTKEGIDPKIIDDILEQEIINDGIDLLVNNAIDYIVFGKELDKEIYSSSNINNYFKDNLKPAVNEINKISETKISDDEVEQILNIIYENSEELSNEVDKCVSELENRIYNTEEYQQIKETQDIINKINKSLKLFYSLPVTIIFIIIIIIICLLIAATRRSIINSLSWIGTSLLLSGIIFFIIYIGITIIYNYTNLSDVPNYIMNLIIKLYNDIKEAFIIESIKNIIIGILLIIIRVILKREQKKKLETI